MILPIKTWPEPILSQKCHPWDFDNPPLELKQVIEQNLVETMLSENAYGLAANQVGIGYRIIAMNVQAGEYAGQQIVLVNPIVSKQSDELWVATEGCLSFPRIELVISRAKYVFAHWYDLNNISHSGVFSEIDAKCLLHEIDHLNGRVFKDYVSDLKFKMAVKRAKKK